MGKLEAEGVYCWALCSATMAMLCFVIVTLRGDGYLEECKNTLSTLFDSAVSVFETHLAIYAKLFEDVQMFSGEFFYLL